MYEKVGRLKPVVESDTIRVIVDGFGDIGVISREEMEKLLAGEESGVVELPVEEGYVVYAWQVRNMLEKWPRKKVAVFHV